MCIKHIRTIQLFLFSIFLYKLSWILILCRLQMICTNVETGA